MSKDASKISRDTPGLKSLAAVAFAGLDACTPAPEGEACPTCNGVRPEFCSNAFHLASPVVPVGVIDRLKEASAEAKKAAALQPSVRWARVSYHDIDAIIAALRPTDTGWREITAEARNGDDVLAYDDETGDCHVSHWTGDYWYGPNGFKPTHWMPLPPAPTDTGANHD